MKFWTVKQALVGHDVSDDVSDVLVDVMNALGFEPLRPCIVGIAEYEKQNDYCVYELLFELAPGVRIFSQHVWVEDLSDGEMGTAEKDLIVVEVMEELAVCEGRVEQFADILHAARVEARQLISAWNVEGLNARLVDVHVATFMGLRGNLCCLVR